MQPWTRERRGGVWEDADEISESRAHFALGRDAGPVQASNHLRAI